MATEYERTIKRIKELGLPEPEPIELADNGWSFVACGKYQGMWIITRSTFQFGIVKVSGKKSFRVVHEGVTPLEFVHDAIDESRWSKRFNSPNLHVVQLVLESVMLDSVRG